MGHVPLFDELALVAAIAVLVTVFLARFKLPAVAGLLASGALIGPQGFGLVRSVETIEALAEIGVVFLLFSIGLELSLARLREIFRQVALGSLLQVALTTGAVALTARAFGEPAGRSLFYGFAFALSSTAIVLRALTERRELDAPHGRFIVGTLIFQDLCVVPMVLVVPLLGPGAAGDVGFLVVRALALAAVVVVLALGISRFVVPKVLDSVDASQSREVFLLAILGICIGTAWLTSLVGLSLALGAFLGGLVVSDTEYGHRAMGDILPLRDTFVSLFFVSLGMLFDVAVVRDHLGLVLLLLLGFSLCKGLLATVAALAMRFPSRVAWLAGVGLAQFGEFGFVLQRLAEENGVIGRAESAPLLSAGILSMFLTPLLVRIAPHVTAGERMLGPLERLIGVRGIDDAEPVTELLRDHAIIIGFGLAGRLAARSLVDSGVGLVVLDLSAANVRAGKAMGMPVYYGDATSEEALRHAHVERARAVVVMINDRQAAARIVDTVRRVRPDVNLLVRTHYLSERAEMLKLGAKVVVAEEVEGAVEVIARLLRGFDVPRNLISERIRGVRSETQESIRRQTLPRSPVGEVSALADMKIEWGSVRPGSALAGRSPAEARVQSVTGALVVGVRRGATLLESVDPHAPLCVDDVVYFVGTGDALRDALELCDAASSAPPSVDLAH